jgi:hypothetical protein
VLPTAAMKSRRMMSAMGTFSARTPMASLNRLRTGTVGNVRLERISRVAQSKGQRSNRMLAPRCLTPCSDYPLQSGRS